MRLTKKNITKIDSTISITKGFDGIKEWDTVSGYIIANVAGSKLIDIKTSSATIYI